MPTSKKRKEKALEKTYLQDEEYDDDMLDLSFWISTRDFETYI